MDELVLKLHTIRQFDWAVVAFDIKPYPTIKDVANWLMRTDRLACMVPKPYTSTSNQQQPSRYITQPRNLAPVSTGVRGNSKDTP